MGPGQAGTWNKVPKPMHTANAISESKGKTGFAGAGGVKHEGAKDYENKMATAVSNQSVQKVGNGSVKKSKYSTPKADVRFTEGRNTMENMTDSMGPY